MNPTLYHSSDSSWPRYFLLAVGVVLLLFGFLYLLWPDDMASLSGTGLTSSTARIEYQAYYGGLQLGLGAFLCAMVLKGVEFRLLLSLVFYCFFCVVVVRLIGLVVGTTAGEQLAGFHVAAIGLELIVVIVALTGLRLKRSN